MNCEVMKLLRILNIEGSLIENLPEDPYKVVELLEELSLITEKLMEKALWKISNIEDLN